MNQNRRLPLLLVILLLLAGLRVWMDFTLDGPLKQKFLAFQKATSASYKRQLVRQRFKQTLEWHGKLIPEGTFLMGTPRKEQPYLSAYPEFPATLQAYYLGERNVSKWEWNTVVRATKHLGYEFRNWKQDSDWDSGSDFELLDRPMEAMSWLDAAAWCNAKSELHGLDPAYWIKVNTKSGWDVFRGSKALVVQVALQENVNGYRLPTEAEWERAARGGLGRARYPWGDFLPENPDTLPNAFGLVGMVSNPGNWCWDKFAPYTEWTKTNPTGPTTSKGVSNRVLRGRPEKGTPAGLIFVREQLGEGDPVGGLRLAKSVENPWVSVLGGVFQMGDTYVLREADPKTPHAEPREFKEGAPDESPVHAVSVEDFLLYRSEVPWDDWIRVKLWAERNGYSFENHGNARRDDYPVTNINWYDAIKWCNAKSEMDGLVPFYHTDSKFTRGNIYRGGNIDVTPEMVDKKATGYRLPSEAEWERAAKGLGEDHRFPCGKNIGQLQAVFMDERMEGKPPKRTLIAHPVFTGGPAPARTYASREIYNLTGNVREWCMDVYAPYLRYPTEVLEVTPDPKVRSMRGGSWRTSGWDCRSSRRFKANASETFDDVGFRIVCK